MQWGSNHNTIAKIHQQVASDDHVCVIWIEDLAHYKELALCIKTSSSPHAKAMVYLFVNPLKESGLYWVRILVPSLGSTSTSLQASQRLNENALVKWVMVFFLCLAVKDTNVHLCRYLVP